MIESKQVQAVSLGHALDVDSVGIGVVHSVFARAVNLMIRERSGIRKNSASNNGILANSATIDGDMWTLLAEDKADLPFGIRVALPSFDTLGLRSGDLVSVRSGFVGIGSHLVVDCRAASRWAPASATKPVLGLERRLAVVATAVANRSWCDSAQMAQAVRSAVWGRFETCRHIDATALGDVLATVVGRGPGATPSGDDVLVGVLAVLTSPHSGKEGARAAEALSRSLLPLLPGTTDVSGHLLRQAVNGLFGRDLHELVNALIGAPSQPVGGVESSEPTYEVMVGSEDSNHPTGLGEKVRRVVETGATSGADTCQGLLAFAPSFFVTRKERGQV